jgi:uncharacterized protein
MQEISTVLLELLSCPITGDKLVYDKINKLLISENAKLAYPIVDGIPMLLESEAKKIL